MDHPSNEDLKALLSNSDLDPEDRRRVASLLWISTCGFCTPIYKGETILSPYGRYLPYLAASTSLYEHLEEVFIAKLKSWDSDAFESFSMKGPGKALTLVQYVSKGRTREILSRHDPEASDQGIIIKRPFIALFRTQKELALSAFPPSHPLYQFVAGHHPLDEPKVILEAKSIIKMVKTGTRLLALTADSPIREAALAGLSKMAELEALSKA